ncbi:MAG: hypothetical protein KatS3mg063_2674 [Tepidiforma sp.]|uniref:hypothetical protein n=1 Tax=Tepidiforma sp. TaxID=2682230 RepID=UPI0021DDAFB3|nr:hypothetical protein [Tepidiforma sp.]GIV93837.1 MAG: hypothetical protein KatS3mg056_2546 [Chloroflexus sp.]GIW16821.1 MAG: hypothetical protein KatS3mg063_2674 [Tepidiforma sp.]
MNGKTTIDDLVEIILAAYREAATVDPRVYGETEPFLQRFGTDTHTLHVQGMGGTEEAEELAQIVRQFLPDEVYAVEYDRERYADADAALQAALAEAIWI